MSDEQLNHRLAAILAADVVGYSRMMAANDRATVTALDAARKVFRTAIEANRGRVIDMVGDAVLACFDAAASGVNTAMAVQRELAAAAADIPEDRRMRFRIGIHLGDVIQKNDGTVYGDGVNIAARLESLSLPGGVAVSEAIRMAVKGKVDATFIDQGERTVKNIPDAVRVFCVAWEGSPAAAELPALPADKPSIAVLPFANMSGDPEQEFFADGIAEDIITELSRISGLLVIARNSTFVFKKQAVDIQDIGKRFGVRHVLEGSVRKAGARVRITAQLIDASTAGHVWAEKYDRNLEDIFAVQDEVTQSIVEQLRVKLTTAEVEQRAPRGRVNVEVYDLTMRARALHFRYSAEMAAEARELLDRALEIEPTFARAHAVLGMVHAAEYINGWVTTPGHVEQGLEHARRAVELDPDEADGHYAIAILSLWLRNYDVAEPAATKAITVAPSYAVGYICHGQVMDFTGRHDLAIASFEQALRFDPASDLLIHLIGRAQFGVGRLADAEASFRRRIARNPRTDMSRAYLASICGTEGQHDEARALWAEIQQINPEFSLDHLRKVLPYKDPAWFDRLAGGLRAAGLLH